MFCHLLYRYRRVCLCPLGYRTPAGFPVLLWLLCAFSARAQQLILPGEVVISEVLFHPPEDGYDYIEGYNSGIRTLSLGDLFIGNRNSSGELASIRTVSRSGQSLAPGRYFVITPNENWLKQRFRVGAEAVVCVQTLHSFPNGQGTVALLTGRQEVIDELRYSAKWHFPLLNEVAGIALERIQLSGPTQDSDNWASAAASSGYGTPGAANSQSWNGRDPGAAVGEVEVSPFIFTPDQDGRNDFGLIRYSLAEPGYLANLAIFDLSGRKVRQLLRNQVLGLAGQFKWDGLDERLNRLPQGIYILVTELFNLEGQVKKFRHSIVLARGP